MQCTVRTLLRAVAFTAAAFVIHSAWSASYPARSTTYIDSLDRYLERAHQYTDNVIRDLNGQRRKSRKLSPEQRMERLAEIGSRYEQISVDSAMTVYDEGDRLAKHYGNRRYKNKFTYRRGSVMPMMGLVREGIDTYLSVDPDSVDLTDRLDYYTTGKHIFDAAVDYYAVDSLKVKYRKMSQKYSDMALHYVAAGSVDEIYYNALPKLHGSERSIGVAELTDVMARVDMTDPLFAKSAAMIGQTAMDNGDSETARYYLAVSAMGDLVAGTREATSLHRLGHLLYDEEDYDRAYDYLAYALESAVESGSRLRTIEIGEIMPVVVKTGRELERRRNRTLTIVVISLSVAMCVFIGILIYVVRTRARLHRLRRELSQLNDSKDAYIRKLISLCGVYLAALENFNKLAGRKIKVGQVNDLLIMIESGRIMRDQLQVFYEVFDDAFLMVYPDFVEQVNKFLLPDKKLSLTENGRLSTELRILAFMRLGMDDSAQIAKFLGLSLNTVYTYRNKVKTRAIDRAEFENQVKNIGKQG